MRKGLSQAFFCILLAGLLFSQLQGAPVYADENPADLAAVVQKINTLFDPPVMISADTRFEGVHAASPKEMVFEYTLVYMTANSEILPPLISVLRKSISKSSCDKQEWHKYLGVGISISVQYNTIDGEQALRMTTDPGSCGL